MRGDQTDQASHLLPTDANWRPDTALLSTLTPVIAQLRAYVMRYFNADAGHGEPVSVDDERALAEKVTALGAALYERADRREASGELPATVEGEIGQPPTLGPGQPSNPGTAMDNGP